MPCSEISENRYNSSLLHQIGTQWIKWKPIYQVYPQHCHAYFALKWTDILHLKEMSCSELSENSFNSSLLHKIVMLIFLYLKLTDIFSDVSYQEVEEVAGYEVEEVEGYEVEEVEWEEEWIEEEVEDEEDEDVEDQEEEEDEDEDQVDEREGEQEKGEVEQTACQITPRLVLLIFIPF